MAYDFVIAEASRRVLDVQDRIKESRETSEILILPGQDLTHVHHGMLLKDIKMTSNHQIYV